jgi:endonuclease YncB( thermonuclease family)
MGKVWANTECEPFNTPWRTATMLRVVDADTFDMRINVGFGVNGPEVRVRLLREGAFTTPQDPKDDGVDAWEVKGSEKFQGLLAKERVEHLIQPGDEVRIFSQRGGKVDGMRRWLSVVLVNMAVGEWRSLGDLLMEEGHATEWHRS